jgi:hypothetical protein
MSDKTVSSSCVELVPDILDFGDVKNDYVSGIGRITKLSNGVVRVTFYAVQSSHGEIERRIVSHLVCPIEALAEWQAAIATAADALAAMPPLHGATSPASRLRAH